MMRLGLGLSLCSIVRGGTPAVPTAPGAVSNLSAARGNQQAVLAWSAPSSGGSPITDYVVEYKLASEPTTWTTFADGTSPSTGATVTSLTNGSAYNFRVKAVNVIGTGNASNIANATPATTPAAPSLSLTPGDGQISIAWTDGSTGGSAITSHNLYRGTTSGSLTLLGLIMSSSPYVDSTVTNGTTYYYKIAAVNDVGEGALSTEQSATPNIADAPVTTFDGTTFSNVNGDSGQWYRDGAAISGQTGSTYNYVEANDLGRAITQVVGGQSSNAIVVTAVASAIIYDFNQPNGTKLSAYPGQPMTMLGGNTGEQDKYTCQSNKFNVTPLSSSAPQAMAVCNVGANHEVTIKIDGSVPSLMAASSDASNHLRTEINDGGAGRWMIQADIAGVTTNQTPNGIQVAGSVATGKHPTLAIKAPTDIHPDGQWQFRIDDLPYAKAPGFGSASAQTDIWYDFPPGFVAGPYAGLRGSPYDTYTCDDLTLLPLDNAINITSVTIVETEAGSSVTRKLRLTGTCLANVLNSAEVLILGEDGHVLVNWTSVSGAPGAGATFTIDSPDVPSTAQGELKVYLRDTTNKATAAVAPVNYPIFHKFILGLNNSGQDVQRNLFGAGEIRFPEGGYKYLWQPGRAYDPANPQVVASDVNMGYDGTIQSYAPGMDANFKWLFGGVDVEPGDYDIYWDNPAMSCALTNNNGGTLVDASILTPLSAGYGRIRVLNGNPLLRFTFSGGASGSLNLAPRGYLVSDTNRSRPYLENNKVPFTTISAKVERHLDTLLGNGQDDTVRTTAGQIWTGAGHAGGIVSPEFIFQKANAQGTAPWVPFCHLWQGDDYLYEFMDRIIFGLAAELPFYVEPPNEGWNSQFKQAQWLQIQGVNAGFYNTLGNATPEAATVSKSYVGHDPSTGYMLRTFNSGELVFFDNLFGVGSSVMRAKKAIAIGSTDKIERSGNQMIENAAWSVVSQFSGVTLAQQRYYSEWAMHLFAIAEQVCIDRGYDPRQKLVRVGAWQVGAPPSDILDWKSAHQKYDAWAIAPYWGNGLLNYSTYTSDEHALLASDPTSFLNTVMKPKTAAAVAERVSEFPALKASIDAAFTSRGYKKGEKRVIAYEGGWHPQKANDTGTWGANLGIVFPALRRSADFQTWGDTYLQGWKDNFHDLFCHFHSLQTLSTGYQGDFGYWGLMENYADTSNPLILGYNSVAQEA